MKGLTMVAAATILRATTTPISAAVAMVTPIVIILDNRISIIIAVNTNTLLNSRTQNLSDFLDRDGLYVPEYIFIIKENCAHVIHCVVCTCK